MNKKILQYKLKYETVLPDRQPYIFLSVEQANLVLQIKAVSLTEMCCFFEV